jgi:hypothetical protein
MPPLETSSLSVCVEKKSGHPSTLRGHQLQHLLQLPCGRVLLLLVIPVYVACTPRGCLFRLALCCASL